RHFALQDRARVEDSAARAVLARLETSLKGTGPRNSARAPAFGALMKRTAFAVTLALGAAISGEATAAEEERSAWAVTFGAGAIGFLARVRHRLGGSDGTLIDAGVMTHLPPLPGLFVSATAMLTWADGQSMRSYFGAPAAGPGLRSFTPGAGLREASLFAMAFHGFDDHWGVQAMARVS